MQIEICAWYKPKKEYVPVSAELLPNMAPHLADVATWAVHQGVEDDRLWWLVTNLETGCHATYDTGRGAVIRKAREVLAKKTPEDILSRYRKVMPYIRKLMRTA